MRVIFTPLYGIVISLHAPAFCQPGDQGQVCLTLSASPAPHGKTDTEETSSVRGLKEGVPCLQMHKYQLKASDVPGLALHLWETQS